MGLAYNSSTNLSLRLLEATDDVRPFREDFNYNFELVDDIFDDVTTIEFAYLDGVTSPIQTQLNAKQGLDAQLTDVAGLAVTDGGIIVGDGTNFVLETGVTARASLGLTIGTNIQAYDAGLLSIAALTTAANKSIYTTALDTYAVYTLTAFARTILDDANASTARTTLGLAIGTNVMAWDAQLDDIAALAYTDSNFIVGDGSNWVAESGATARASLGLTIGNHVQAYDAALTSVSGLTYVSPSFIKLTADDTYAVRTLAETLTDIGGAALQGVEAIGAVTFNDGTHILSVATITYWFNGATYTTASPTTCDIDSFETLTNNTLYYFYFDDATGTLKCSDTDWNFTTQVMVATVFWNGTNGAIQKEWHDHISNIAWHEWAHTTVGTRYEAGLSLTAPTTAADATLTIESGSVKDEDLEITIGQQSTSRIIYKASASIYTWVDSSLPYAGSSADPKWLDTDSYTLTSVGNSDFVCMWVYATNDADRHIYIIPTHAADAHNIIAQARAETAPVLSDLNLNPEMKLIYRFIYKGDGEFQESNDYRLTSPLPSGGSASTNASAVSFSPSGNIAATTVQTALEEVDAEKVSLTGDEVLTNKDYNFVDALGTDHFYSGQIDSQPVGENVVFGQLLYYDWTDVEWKLAKADTLATAKATRIALESKSDGQTCLMLVKGYIRDDSAFDFGAARIFLNDDTFGTCDDTAPAESGDQIFVVGEAKSADILFFDPSKDIGEI